MIATEESRAGAAAGAPDSPLERARRELGPRPVDEITGAEIGQWDRLLAADPPADPVEVALVGNTTLDLFAPAVRVMGARQGLPLAPWIGAFGGYAVELLGEDAPLVVRQPAVVLLLLDLEALRPDAFRDLAVLSGSDRRALRDDVLEHVGSWIEAARERLGAAILVASFPAPPRARLGIADLGEEYGESELMAELNLELLRRCKRSSRVHLFDFDGLVARVGRSRARDRRLAYLAGTPWSRELLAPFGAELARAVTAVTGRARKALVLDLDDTLWGGIVGEDGPEGIRCGPGTADGPAFHDFQRRLLDLKRRGVLLAVCSKNNEADVLEAFARRPEMPLSPEDFAATAIDWSPKPANLRSLAEALGIGLDSLVFLDDNPAEIALVRDAVPEVEARLLPTDPARRPDLLDELPFFEKATILPDDAGKTEQYRQNAARRRARSDLADLEGYLHGLETRLHVAPLAPEGLPRAHQLVQKTNQFNLTTRRHGLGELERRLEDPDWELWTGAVTDRFGDLGVVALAMLERCGPGLVLDTFLLSCRALGREVETAFMNHLKGRLRADPQAEELVGIFRPTAKNAPAAGFFARQGFRPAGEEADGAERWLLDRAAAAPLECPWIELRA